jgi:hypothetical protein
MYMWWWWYGAGVTLGQYGGDDLGVLNGPSSEGLSIRLLVR